MRRVTTATMMMVCLLTGGLFLTGCDDDDNAVNTVTEVIQVKPQVNGFIIGEGGGPKKAGSDGSIWAMLSVTGAPVTPAVSVNGEALGLEPELTIYGGGFGFNGNLVETVDANYDVQVDMGDLAGACTIIVPESSEWTDPVGGRATVTPGQELTVAWTAVTNTTGYLLNYDFEVNYTDTLGSGEYWENDGSLYLTATTATFTVEDLFPPVDEVQSIDSFWGDMDLMPINGPIMPGSSPNVTGGATGFVFGAGGDLDLDMDLDQQPTKTTGREMPRERIYEALQSLFR
ncbi:MAG: hypothetical protein GY838_15910 [bacterium]|nr:hypothetical protein [bacterium]